MVAKKSEIRPSSSVNELALAALKARRIIDPILKKEWKDGVSVFISTSQISYKDGLLEKLQGRYAPEWTVEFVPHREHSGWRFS